MIEQRRVKWVGHVNDIGKNRNVYRILVEKPEGMVPFEIHSHRLEDIKMALKNRTRRPELD